MGLLVRKLFFLDFHFLSLAVALSFYSFALQASTTDEKKNQKPWSVSFESNYLTQLIDKGDGPPARYGGIGIVSSYTFAKTIAASLETSGSQDLNEKKWETDDALLSMSLVPKFSAITNRFKYSTGFRFLIPVTEDTRATSLRTNVAWLNSFAVNQDFLPTKKLGLRFSLTPSKSFHEYDTAENGKINTSHSLAKGISTDWNFTDSLSFSFSYVHSNHWKYRGNQTESWSHSEVLSYEMKNGVSLSMGHQFGLPAASVYKPDGRTLNIDFINAENSYVFVSAGFGF